MNEKIEKKPVFLSPFKRFCMTIGELPTSYLETMTYYEMLLWFTKYLGETVIPTINNNAEAVDEMQKLFVELQDYVNTYFENLDIQTEVNNKLDEMAESGQLADIIAQYLELNGVLAFDTKNDLKNAENLVNGSICKTLGELSYLDGKGYFYKVRTLTSSDVVDDNKIVGLVNYPTLIAEKVPNIFSSEINGSLTLSVDYRDCEERINGVTNDNTPIAGLMQGMTTTENSYIVIERDGGINDATTNMCFIKEISKTTKAVIKQAHLQLFHGNAVAYNKTAGEVYVACNSMYDELGQEQENNNIIVLNYNDFSIKTTITPPTSITSNNRVRSVSYDNKNNVLALADTNDVWIMDNWTTVNTHITLEDTFTNKWHGLTGNETTNQNTVVFDNKIYSIRYAPNGINVFNMDGKLIQNYYTFDIDLPILMGELESIAIEENGDIFFGVTQYSQSDNTVNDFPVYKIYDNIIYKSNLLYNGFKNYLYSSNIQARITFYVNSATTNKHQLGTYNEPFKCIEQAIFSIESIAKDVSCNITLMGENQQYTYLMTRTNNHIILNGNNNYIYGVQIDNQKMIINNVQIRCDSANCLAYSQASPVRIYTPSDVQFKSCTFTGISKLGSCIYVRDSKVELLSCTINNFTNIIDSTGGNVDITLSGITSNSDYWYLCGTNTDITYTSNSILNAVNPSSSNIPNVHQMQLINHTFSNNTLTFTNTAIDRGQSPASLYLFLFRITLDGNEYYINCPAWHNEKLYTSVERNGTIYEIFINSSHTHGSGVWTFNPIVYKSTSTGSRTSVTPTLGMYRVYKVI